MIGFSIGRDNDYVVIVYDNYPVVEYLRTIISKHNLAPDAIFNIMSKYGKWNKNEKDYYFDDFLKAAQAIEEIEGRIVMEKLTEEG